MAISSTDIRYGYSFILGRRPESEAAITAHAVHNDISAFREILLQSSEFRVKYRALLASTEEHPYLCWNREAVAFLHVPKTAGLTLHTLLSACFPEDHVLQERQDHLHCYAPAELAKYDLFSGHFGPFSLRFIPRQRVRRVSIFRDPSDRLISWYRFLRSHPPSSGFSNDPLIPLANELDPEEFFEDHRVLSSPGANNAYLFFFGLPAPYPVAIDALANESIVSEVLRRAKQEVLELDAIGLTERFDESVELIFTALGLPIPQAIPHVNATDDLPAISALIKPVPPVPMTLRLSRALEPLTKYDREIYDLATQEFERRRAAARSEAQHWTRPDAAAQPQHPMLIQSASCLTPPIAPAHDSPIAGFMRGALLFCKSVLCPGRG